MRYDFVDSENPDEHWGFLDVRDCIVLDLGCGYFGAGVEQSTPEFFVERGAKQVIGVDLSLTGLQHVTDPTIAFIEMEISNAQEISNLYKRFLPQVVKCDIEGAEALLFAVPDGAFKIPVQYAIETHTEQLFDQAWDVLRHYGYRIKRMIDLIHAPDCRVIHAVR